MSITAMKQALNALEELNKVSIGVDAVCLPGEIDTAMDALRTAIEQAEKQEPVAWITAGRHTVPLRITPPAAQWIGLTDEERRACAQSPFVWENYLAIEAKLKEKNNG